MNKFTFLLVTLINAISYSQNAGDIIITEIMQNPGAVSDTFGEYFEIYNTTANAIDIEGWIIRDNDANSHVISNGGSLLVPSNSYFVLGRNGEASVNGGYTTNYVYSSFTLANGFDEVVIALPTGLIIDSVVYDDGSTFPDPDGSSMEFTLSTAEQNDSGLNWVASTSSFGAGDKGTPGKANTITTLSVFDIAVNEFEALVYPNPSVDEIVNIITPSKNKIEVEVYDLKGQKVIETSIAGQTLNVAPLDPGIYIMNLIQATKKVAIKLVVE